MSDFDDVTLSGTDYKIPKATSSAPWGEELNDYLKALGEAYSTLVGVGDIPETAAVIANNQSSPVVVTGLSFDSALVKSAQILYSINRQTTGSSLNETGQLTVLYDSTKPVNQKWSIQRDMIGEGEIEFTINDSGAVLYTTNNQIGASYTGLIKFEAKATLQT